MIDINFTEDRDLAYAAMEILGRPSHVAEVGTFNPGHLQVLPFLFDDKCRVQLFEPNPECVSKLRAAFREAKNVEINEVAIGEEYGQAILQVPVARRNCPNAGSSAFLQGVRSPYHAREAAGRKEEMDDIRVEIAPLSEFDDGGIEVLAVDTEGGEWGVLLGMVSRPKVIGLEMRGKFGYENPFTSSIEQWMADNGYVEYFRGETDNIYTRNK